jgi:mannitol-1-phosphate 5-dehydrogenase
MNATNNNWQINSNKIVIFGAGKIGRSFIGQLFGTNGYEVVFIDVDPHIIQLLNERNEYRVVIKADSDTEIIVKNVSAISGLKSVKVSEAVATAGILAVSVGKNALSKVIPVIASGLKIRNEKKSGIPLDIILAENMRDAASFVKEKLEENLPPSFPLENLVGLVETSIGKMVPIIPLAELNKDPLVVFAEPYNTLIVDQKGFKAPIPEVKGLAPKENIKAWVDRKAFIHNLGHATAAYYGFYKHPEATYMYEVLDDPDVFRFTRETMMQSAEMLQLAYPIDFSLSDLTDHVDDLLIRFRNKALKDTIFRVGQDLVRKLGPNDRFMGAIRLAKKTGMPHDKIEKAMSYGFCFKATDELGNPFNPDLEFLESLSSNFNATLTNKLGFNTSEDRSSLEYFNLFLHPAEISSNASSIH